MSDFTTIISFGESNRDTTSNWRLYDSM